MTESEILINISDNLHSLLDGTKTICDFAKRIGIDRTNLWRMMNLQKIPKLHHLIKIAEELDVTLDWLVNRH